MRTKQVITELPREKKNTEFLTKTQGISFEVKTEHYGKPKNNIKPNLHHIVGQTLMSWCGRGITDGG